MRTARRAPLPLAAAVALTAAVALADVHQQRKNPHRARQADSDAVSAQLSATEPTSDSASSESNLFLFVGGLQRSGTTWLEAIVTSPETSALSFENVDPTVYAEQQPWRLQNHSQAYFEMVARVGGVEGKFVQDVYPYSYLVRDVGKDGHSIESLLPDERASKSADAAARLYKQWSMWWDTSKRVLVEKTPENLLMGPFLQSAFGAHRTRFIFVMRHPLVLSLIHI